jgi:hypothetical protein
MAAVRHSAAEIPSPIMWHPAEDFKIRDHIPGLADPVGAGGR